MIVVFLIQSIQIRLKLVSNIYKYKENEDLSDIYVGGL